MDLEVDRKYVLLGAVVLLAGGYYMWQRPPSASGIVESMSIEADAGIIEYDGVRFEAVWGDPVEHQGEVRALKRAYSEYAPFMTLHVVLTTGDYSNPDIVELSDIDEGNIRFYWQKDRPPQGSLIVLHLTPTTPEVQSHFDALEPGKQVVFSGREEVDSRIDSPRGWLALNHDNHRYVLVTSVNEVLAE